MRASCRPAAKLAVQTPPPSTSISPSTTTDRFQLSRSVPASRNFDVKLRQIVVKSCHKSTDEAAAAAAATAPQTRRSLLLSSAAAAAAGLAASAALAPLNALADEAAAAAVAAPSSSSSLFVPDLRELPLPDSYVETSRALIKALRDAIEADLSDADESKVRRKAEPAKALVREWTSRWGDGRAPAVGGSASHSALSSALRELGGFYSKRGQRARLDQETAGKLLEELAEAEGGLPVEKERKKGLFSLP